MASSLYTYPKAYTTDNQPISIASRKHRGAVALNLNGVGYLFYYRLHWPWKNWWMEGAWRSAGTFYHIASRSKDERLKIS